MTPNPDAFRDALLVILHDSPGGVLRSDIYPLMRVHGLPAKSTELDAILACFPTPLAEEDDDENPANPDVWIHLATSAPTRKRIKRRASVPKMTQEKKNAQRQRIRISEEMVRRVKHYGLDHKMDDAKIVELALQEFFERRMV